MDELETSLRAALGASAVSRGTGDTLRVTPHGREPARLAVRTLAEHRRRWQPRGGGRRPWSRSAVELHTAGLRGVLDFWPEDLVCRVGAGTTFQALDEALAPLDLRLAASAALPDRATLGGAFATGDRGHRGTTGGGLRELVLGLTAVTGDGTLLKAGARVVKNVAGYDMVRLHGGAGGAFGLVLDLVIRLQARPRASRGVFLPCPLDELGVRLPKVRRPATAIDPVMAVWLDEHASHELGWAEEPGLFVLAEGWEDSVAAWARALPAGNAEADPTAVRDFGWAREDRLLLRWLVSPARLIRDWPRLRRDLSAQGLSAALAADCLGGQATIALASPAPLASARARPVRASVLDPNMIFVDRFPGAATRGAAQTRHQDETSAATTLIERLKRAFDPHDLLPQPPSPWSGSHG